VLPTLILSTSWQPPALDLKPFLELSSRIQLGGQGLNADQRQIAEAVRLGLAAERGSVEGKASFQVVRFWLQARGENSVTGNSYPTLAEGWVGLDGTLSENVAGRLVVGRQAIFLNEGRLIGASHYDLNGLFLDALSAELELSPLHLRYINARRFGEPGTDPLGLGVNLVQLGAAGEIPNFSWLFDVIYLVDARHTEARTSTLGVYSRLQAGRLGFRGESYFQQYQQEPLSLLVAFELSWIFGENERFKVLLGYDIAEAGWQKILGGTRDFWGYVDIYSELDENLRDLSLGVSWHPISKVELVSKVHRFAQATEGDLFLRWWISPLVALQGGGGYFWSDSGYRVASQGMGWLELDAKF
jgi:hypothetical protein